MKQPRAGLSEPGWRGAAASVDSDDQDPGDHHSGGKNADLQYAVTSQFSQEGHRYHTRKNIVGRHQLFQVWYPTWVPDCCAPNVTS